MNVQQQIQPPTVHFLPSSQLEVKLNDYGFPIVLLDGKLLVACRYCGSLEKTTDENMCCIDCSHKNKEN